MQTISDIEQFAARFSEASSARELAVRWLLALRSGEFIQGEGSLTQLNSGKRATHCCLGVLCNIDGTLQPSQGHAPFANDIPWNDGEGRWRTWSLDAGQGNGGFGSSALRELAQALETTVGTDVYFRWTGDDQRYDGDDTIISTAIKMNDTGKPFAAIADMLEELLLPLLP